MPKIPEKINEVIYCEKCVCLNNKKGQCILKEPYIREIFNDVWVCADERYL